MYVNVEYFLKLVKDGRLFSLWWAVILVLLNYVFCNNTNPFKLSSSLKKIFPYYPYILFISYKTEKEPCLMIDINTCILDISFQFTSISVSDVNFIPKCNEQFSRCDPD